MAGLRDDATSEEAGYSQSCRCTILFMKAGSE